MKIDWKRAITPEVRCQQEREEQRVKIRTARNQALDSVITVSGVPVETNDATQARLNGLAVAALTDPNYTAQWKTAENTFVQLNAADILEIAAAVRRHVQFVYDHEATLPGALQANEPHAVGDGWPSSSVRLAKGYAVVQKVGTGVYRVNTSEKKWVASAPAGYNVVLSHDEEALTVWVRKNNVLANIPEGHFVTLTAKE